MPRKYPKELHERSVRMMLDRLPEYASPWACAQALSPKLGVGSETLRKWLVQAQVDTGERVGPTSAELAEIRALKAQVRDLEETNAASVFFAGQLDPRRR